MKTRSNDLTIHSGSPLEVKNKNYSRIVVCHRLILTIVIFSCTVTSVYSQQERRIASVQYSEFFRRHNRRRHRRRGLEKKEGDDKQDDKEIKIIDNKPEKEPKETKKPKQKRTINPSSAKMTTHPTLTKSFHPSSLPTLDNPSSIPSIDTSLTPSFHPSSTTLFLHPHSVPTIVNPSSSSTPETLNMSSPNSTIKIGFSILFNNSYITSNDQIDQLNYEQNIASSLLKMFCENDTPVQFFIGSINSDSTKKYPCQTDSSSTTKIFAYSKDQPIEIRKLERVKQERLGTYMSDKWLDVTKKDLTRGSITYFEVFVTYVVLERGDIRIDYLENVMQRILNENINTYLILDGVEEFAPVGNERQTFRSNIQRLFKLKELDMGSSPMNGLQLVGIILMISVIMSYIVIVKTAQNRHSRKVWDAINRKEDRGGLGTPEGLDIILESGRNFKGIIEESAESEIYDDNIKP